MKYSSALLFVLAVAMQAAPAVSTDSGRERLIAAELEKDLDRGEVIWLETAAGNDFPAIYYEAFLGHRGTGIILLHGLGAHPDWPDVIAPIRRALPAKGWPTLSIQLPILPPEKPVNHYGSTLKLAGERIRAAVRYLDELGFGHRVLLGYGFGAATGIHYLAEFDRHRIDAFIGVSMMARKFLSPGIDLEAGLGEIAIPLLDIYGSRDLEVITDTATDRRLALNSAKNTLYHQLKVPEADHYYAGKAGFLVEAISDWLESIETMLYSTGKEEAE